MSILNVGGLTKYYGSEFIFGGISFQVARGEKVALVGVNGAGKSTLLRIIAGEEPPTQGGVHLAQEARFTGTCTLRQEIVALGMCSGRALV